ncbi:MAG: AraC family transcriptional regulator [Robiginitomaculum sp.]|nr:AraC family transcriptional regulator [Robiginitomaculum sp.]
MNILSPYTDKSVANDLPEFGASIHTPLFRVPSLEEANHFIAKVLCPHDISVRDNKDRLDINYRGFRKKEMVMLNIGYGSGVKVAPKENNEFYYAQTTLKGTNFVFNNDDIVNVNEAQSVILSPHNKYRYHLEANTHRLVIAIRHKSLKSYLETALQQSLREDLVFDTNLPNSNVMKIWLNHVENLSHLFSNQSVMANSHHMYKTQLESTMCLMLGIFQHNYSDALNTIESKTTPKRIELAKDYILAHLTESISVIDVAEAACISPRALQYSFKEHVGMSPVQFIRSAKLEAIRLALQKADPTENVTNVLSDFGILSFGHFSKYYKEAYGCTPKSTMMNAEPNGQVFP